MHNRYLAVGLTMFVISMLAISQPALSAQPFSKPTTDEQPDPALEKFLAEFDRKRDAFHDYRASFRQQKYNKLFDEFSEPATGTLTYKKPGRALWDYREPDEMAVLLLDKRVHVYIADLEQMEIYDFSDHRSGRGLFLGFDQSTDELIESYRIKLVEPDDRYPGTRCIELEPRTEDTAAYFTRLKLWMRETDFAVVRILIEGPEEGNLTEIELTDIRVNTNIPDSVFEIDIPPETTIIEHTADELQPRSVVDKALEQTQAHVDEQP